MPIKHNKLGNQPSESDHHGCRGHNDDMMEKPLAPSYRPVAITANTLHYKHLPGDNKQSQFLGPRIKNEATNPRQPDHGFQGLCSIWQINYDGVLGQLSIISKVLNDSSLRIRRETLNSKGVGVGNELHLVPGKRGQVLGMRETCPPCSRGTSSTTARLELKIIIRYISSGLTGWITQVCVIQGGVRKLAPTWIPTRHFLRLVLVPIVAQEFMIACLH